MYRFKAHVSNMSAVTLCLVALTGCVAAPAIISDLETDKVIVQSGMGTTEEAIYTKALEGCQIHGRRPSLKPLSFQCVDQYCITAKHLFPCVE